MVAVWGDTAKDGGWHACLLFASLPCWPRTKRSCHIMPAVLQTTQNAVKAKKELLHAAKNVGSHGRPLCKLTLVGRFAVSLVRLLVQERVGHVARDLDLHEPPSTHGVFVQDPGCLRQGLRTKAGHGQKGTFIRATSRNIRGRRRSGRSKRLADEAHENTQPVECDWRWHTQKKQKFTSHTTCSRFDPPCSVSWRFHDGFISI